MTTNYQTTFNSDVENYIQDKTLPLTQRQLVAYQFGDMLRLPKGRGLVYTASRYGRVNLPFAPLSEGIAPDGEALTLAQVSATAQQWGDTITITDVADMTIKHPLFQKAIELTAMQMAETLERNTFVNLLAGTQVNYVNSRATRANIVAGDVLNPHEINRAAAALYTLGAPQFDGQKEEDAKISAGKPAKSASKSHYVALIHPLPEQDLRENSTIVTAWSYSDINRLYNNELGEWGGIRFCRSNMVPSFVGVAQVNGTGSTGASSGSLADGTYYIQVTGSIAQNGYEQRIYQVSTAVTVGTGSGTGTISVTLPTLAGYVFNVYIGTTTSPTHLAKCASGPTSGPLKGMATRLASGATVTLTDIGVAQTPPAAPATGVTVYPTFVIGKNAYGQVMLDDAKFTYLKTADKFDPLNQLRVVGWKIMYGTLIENQNFFMRIESSSAFVNNFAEVA